MTLEGLLMRLKHLDLILIVTVALMNVIWALLPYHLSIIGTVLALPLVFLLPGYALTEFLVHKLSLDLLRRFIFSIGLSIAMDIIIGFIMNSFSFGLRAISWSVFLGLMTVFLSLTIVYFREKYSFEYLKLPKFHFRIYEYVLIGLSLLTIVLSIWYSAINVLQQPHTFFTELWMQSSKESNNTCDIHLGVQSFEITSVRYRIVMSENGTQVNVWQPVILAPQQEWNRSVVMSPNFTNTVYVEVKLYKIDQPETVYRDVHITLNTSGDSRNRKENC
jgi:hypothetical protein